MADSESDSDTSSELDTRNAKRKSSADSYPTNADDEETCPKKPRIAFTMSKISAVKGNDVTSEKKKNSTPICLKLGAQKPKDVPSVVKPSSASVAKAFNTDDDETNEEMPPEARMRMRNIGRETPTSAGPNSFGKTRQGFCDTKKMFERQIKSKHDHNK